ncbi:diguanylate cyclase [Halofilum ochraceum]|uniref:diguanylate cyclase n=1 Tax=Halofilum ochraceum TaxID=1611323 RepID=UPI0008DA6642|nr:diguanylate cyclase [Halofilum ochraceum]
MEEPARDVLLAGLNAVGDAVLVTDTRLEEPGPTVLYVNSAFEHLTGYAPGEVVGGPARVLMGAGTDATAIAELHAALAAGRPYKGEFVNYDRDGLPMRLEWRIQPFPESGPPSRLLAVLRDVTDLRALEERRSRLEAVTRMQRQVATAGHELDGLRSSVVDAALEATGADGAVVEEPVGDRMVYTAASGTATASLGLELPMAETLSGWCYRTGEAAICMDVTRDERVALQDTCESIGFRSGIIVPLVNGGKTFGVLKVYSGEPDAFSDGDVQVLRRASEVLAASLEGASQYERERQRRQLLVDALPALVSYIDAEKRYREVNDAYRQWFGLERIEIIGRHIREIVGDSAYEEIEPRLEAALTGERVTYEAEIPYRYGGTRPIEADYIPHIAAGGEVAGVYVLVRDVSDRRRAECDWLTGVWNRRVFEERLEALYSTAHRYQRPLSLVFMDIDHFKAVNDFHGHAVGDRVLEGVAALLQECVRDADTVCRWGGEEFAVLLPETSVAEAGELAERIRGRIKLTPFPGVGGITASFGVADLQGVDTRDAFVGAADRALYRAKGDGRDRVAFALAAEALKGCPGE